MRRRKPKTPELRINPARVAATKRKMDLYAEQVVRDLKRSTKILDGIKPTRSLWRRYPQ